MVEERGMGWDGREPGRKRRTGGVGGEGEKRGCGGARKVICRLLDVSFPGTKRLYMDDSFSGRFVLSSIYLINPRNPAPKSRNTTISREMYEIH